MPVKEMPSPVEQNDGTITERRIAQSKRRIKQSRALLDNSRILQLTSIAIFRAKTKQRAAANALLCASQSAHVPTR